MDNITSATIKLISSLGTAAHRRREKLFVAEGSKSVADTLGHFELAYLVATAAWFDEHPKEAARPEALKATARDLGRMSHLSTPPAVIAVYRLPEVDADAPIEADGMILALDSIQDPGNLGTILRTADWMGIHTVIASRETADCYGPKAIQATMGSISRVSVRYVDLPETLMRLKSRGREIYGTLLNGEDIYKAADLTSRDFDLRFVRVKLTFRVRHEQT